VQKAPNVKFLVLAAALADSVATVPFSLANAAGFIDLDFENVPTVIGTGVGMMPDYSGSDDYTMGAAPFFGYIFKDQERYVQLIANELPLNVLDDQMFRFGPLLNYRFDRDDNVDDPMVSKMEEIDGTIEAGAFIDLVWANANEKRQRIILDAKVYQDVGDVSDGFRANLGVRYWQPVAKPVDLNLGAGMIYQDDKYADCYFGVNPGNVGSSIAGDPGDSPIVEQRGDSTQWMDGIGIGYIMW